VAPRLPGIPIYRFQSFAWRAVSSGFRESKQCQYRSSLSLSKIMGKPSLRVPRAP
jgi:hypothetical protein